MPLARPRPKNRADEIFQGPRDNPRGLLSRRPMLHRGAYSIVLSRASPTLTALPRVVAGSIASAISRVVRSLTRADDTITVLRRDRTIIMRKPFDLDVIGKNLATIRTWNPNNLKATVIAGQGPVDRHPGFMSAHQQRPL